MRLPESEDPASPAQQPGPSLLGPLPSRHPYSREQVAHHQRERLIAGLAAIVAERGYPAVTIGQIAAAAHVSRRVFYEHFETKEECFAAAFDAVIDHIHRLVDDAAALHPGDWPRQTTARIRAVLIFFAAEPALACLCLVESLSAGPLLVARYASAVSGFAPVLAAGRAERPDDARPLPASTEVSLVGALASRLGREITLRDAERLPDLLPDLVEFVLAPYLGSEVAARYASEAAAGDGG